jgi:hypothetical protein
MTALEQEKGNTAQARHEGTDSWHPRSPFAYVRQQRQRAPAAWLARRPPQLGPRGRAAAARLQIGHDDTDRQGGNARLVRLLERSASPTTLQRHALRARPLTQVLEGLPVGLCLWPNLLRKWVAPALGREDATCQGVTRPPHAHGPSIAGAPLRRLNFGGASKGPNAPLCGMTSAAVLSVPCAASGLGLQRLSASAGMAHTSRARGPVKLYGIDRRRVPFGMLVSNTTWVRVHER